MGGGGGSLPFYFGQNLFNRNLQGNQTGQAVANLFDPTGMSSYSTLWAADQTGTTSGGQTPTELASLADKPAEIAPAEVPIDETAAATARAAARRKKKQQASSQTIYTSSLGVTDQADISRKTLLGQ